ncbi:class I adenylate-forming enzyme family protein [Planctomycetota bacterium]
MKIIDLFNNNQLIQPQKTAIISGEIRLTYEHMITVIETLSRHLKSTGCRPGVKVAIVLANSIEYLVSFFAISAADGIILPLTAHMTTYEVAMYIQKSEASIVITNKIYTKQLIPKLDKHSAISVFCVRYDVKNGLEVETFLAGDCKADDQNGDVALMVPTSGTTGYPKIAMLTDSQLISNMMVYRSLMGFDGPNIVYCALSFNHIYSICAQILTHTSLADTFVINDKPFFIKDFLKTVQNHAITISAFVPSMAILLSEYTKPDEFDLKSLKYITLSGAKTPSSTYKRLINQYDWVSFINTYGMTEAGSRISIASPFPNCAPIDSVGKPMPGVSVRIVDGERNILPTESIGEIEVKSSGIMKGYYKQRLLTSQIIVDGWLKTGDIGRVDENGNLFLVGRKKDVIISGGENIYPLEIEEHLLEHPAILEAVVVGQEDKLLQEVPVAYIVKKNPSEKLTSFDIIKFCKSKLSSYKIPRSVRFLEKLPRLSTSKLDRSALKEIVVSSF